MQGQRHWSPEADRDRDSDRNSLDCRVHEERVEHQRSAGCEHEPQVPATRQGCWPLPGEQHQGAEARAQEGGVQRPGSLDGRLGDHRAELKAENSYDHKPGRRHAIEQAWRGKGGDRG